MLILFRQSLEKKRYAALNKWTEALEGVHGAVVSKTSLSGNRVEPIMPSETFGRDAWF